MSSPRVPVGAGMPLRDHRIHRYVVAFCPRCHEEEPDRDLADVQRLSGWLAVRDGRVWLERGCARHGLVTTLYDEDPEILTYLERWTAPTKAHTPDVVGNYAPVPSAYLQGLPAMQTQHTCILLEDVTDHCNLKCPTCFASSSPAESATASVDDVLANVDTRLARENGRIDVLMLSGGEPTLHPEFERILDELVARPIVRILVNSNGLRIGHDDELLALLKRHRQRVEVYLQWDGDSAEASAYHRGADLRRHKEAALARLSEAGIFTTLTMTATLGVNDHLIGEVVQKGLDTPYVGGVTIQPVFGSGRSSRIDPLDRLTHTGVLKRLGPQTDGLVTWRDLTALPCSHPHCCSVGYLLKDDSGAWRSLVSIVGTERLASFLELEPDVLANRIADQQLPAALRGAVKQSLLDLLSEQSSLSHPSMTDVWRNICTACDLGVGTLSTLVGAKLPGGQERLRDLLGRRVMRVTVKPFMDMNTMIEERLTQCCVHVGTVADEGAPGTAGGDLAHQCAPFCAVQAWAPLGRTRLSTGVARACGPDREPEDLPLIAAARLEVRV